MFRGLIASLPTGTHHGGYGMSGAISVVVHLAVLGAAMAGTSQPKPPPHVIALPPDSIVWPREAPKGTGTLPWDLRPTFPVWHGPLLAPDISLPPVEPERLLDVWRAPGSYQGVIERMLPEPADADAASAYLESIVDERPERLRTPALDYPELLRQAGTEGVVLIEVIVDSAGVPEPAGLRIVRSDHRAFEAPARRAVLRSVFRPGRVRGRPVRVLVQIPVSFAIRRY